MLIEVIHHQAEQLLLARVEQSGPVWGALYLQCSRQRMLPNEELVVFATRTLLTGRKATIYFFQDGDFVVTWHGAQKTTVEALRRELYDRLGLSPDVAVDRYCDSQAQGEELRLLCKHKLETLNPGEVILVPKSPATLRFDQPQETLFRRAAQNRPSRKMLEMLVVEDQAFSAKLLLGLLDRTYKAVAADNAELAWNMYLAQAPDIVFLDVELPGMSGHDLAAAIHKLDPQAFIVMVTGNHYVEDVARAKENNAKGFIVKPYSKQKILDSIQKYINQKHPARKG